MKNSEKLLREILHIIRSEYRYIYFFTYIFYLIKKNIMWWKTTRNSRALLTFLMYYNSIKSRHRQPILPSTTKLLVYKKTLLNLPSSLNSLEISRNYPNRLESFMLINMWDKLKINELIMKHLNRLAHLFYFLSLENILECRQRFAILKIKKI